MSSITFNPPVGRTVHVDIPYASVRPTVLLFTARLSGHDHDQIVKNGGRIQLWTDIPDEEHTGGWRALDFMERSPAPGGLVVLQPDESPVEHEELKCLYLMVRPPESVQFTYRVLYPSGAIVWLGQYGQNGSIFLEESRSLNVDGLDINAGWTLSETRQAYVSKSILHEESLEVLRLRALADFRIIALAEQGLLPNLENARLLFFIPRTQQSISIRPTYVLSSSPELSMTVLADGGISVSGSGTMMLSVHDIQRDPTRFIQDHIQNCGLNTWNVIPCNEGVPTVVLVSGGPHYPAEAIVIPLWPSEHLQNFQAPVTNFFEAIGNRSLAAEPKLAILPPDNSKLHLFDHGHPTENVVLQFDLAHNQFKFSPIYQLRAFDGPSPGARKALPWKAVVFSSHNVVQDPFAKRDHDLLPTPPPSPLLRPVAHLTESTVSVDTVASNSGDTLPSDNGILLGLGSDSKQDDNLQNLPLYPSSVRRTDSQSFQTLSLLWRLTQRLPSPRTFLVTLVKSYLSALTALMKFFICLWVIPFRRIWRPRRQIGSRVSVSAAESLAGSKNPAFPESQDTSAQAQHENLNGNDPDRIHSMAVIETDVVSPVDEADQAALANASPSHEMLFIELHRDAEAIDSKNTTARIAILIPNDKLSPEDVVISSSVVDSIACHAVRFVKGVSEFETPGCTISRCNMITRNGRQDEQERIGSCYLLTYKLIWDEGQKGKIICLSAPPL